MSNPSKANWTGACLQGNARLLSPRLFATGRGWSRGPSSRGQFATAAPTTGHTGGLGGQCGLLLHAGDPSGAIILAKTAADGRNLSEEDFFSTCTRAQPSWVGPTMHRGSARRSLYVITTFPVAAASKEECRNKPGKSGKSSFKVPPHSGIVAGETCGSKESQI